MIPSLSGVTTLNATFAEDIQACADAGCQGLEVWLTKLESYLQGQGAWATPESIKHLLQERNVRLLGAAYQGGLIAPLGEGRRPVVEQWQRRLQLCQEFAIPVLIIVPDALERVDSVTLSSLQASLVQWTELAAAFHVKLALEFRSSSRWCASIPTALALIESVGSPHLGLCLDIFHYYTGPSKFEDLGLLTPDNLFAVHVCDLSGVAREMAADADRILPGDGDFQLKPLIDHLSLIGYQGYVSVELMNPEIWKIKPVQVAEAAITSLRILLGQTELPASLQLLA